jgi:beta-N-acetylhexosaminidase
MGHVAYDALEPEVPASMSAAAYRLLRQLGFTGAAITDSIGMGAVNLRWDFDEGAVRAVAAGADGVLATDGSQARRMRDALIAAVQSGSLDEARLDEAAGRMMALAGGDPRALTCRSAGIPGLR